MITSLKIECFKILVVIIARTRHERELSKIEPIANYIQKLPDCLLEQLFYWVVTLNTCRVTVDGDMSDESRVSSNEVAICFYPKKEEFWLRRWTLSCRVKGFLELIGQNLSNLKKFRYPPGYELTQRISEKLYELAPNLQILNLRNAEFKDGCWEPLLSLNLKELDLSKTDFKGFGSLLQLQPNAPIQTTLRVLNIKSTYLKYEIHYNLELLEYFINLEELITDISIQDLLQKACSNKLFHKLIARLKSMKFKKIKICVFKIDNYLIKSFEHVEHLKLRHLENFEQVMQLLKLMGEKVKTLTLSLFFVKITENYAAEKHVFHFPNLESMKVFLPHALIPNHILAAFFIGAQNLVNLKVIGGKVLTDFLIFETFTNSNLKRLKHLDLLCTENIGTEGILFLMAKKSLNRLFIRYYSEGQNNVNINFINEMLRKNDNEWTVINSAPVVNRWALLWVEKIKN